MKTFDVWLANLNPNKGKEPRKIHPVIIVPSPLFNDFHPTVIICTITSQINENSEILRHGIKENLLRSLRKFQSIKFMQLPKKNYNNIQVQYRQQKEKKSKRK